MSEVVGQRMSDYTKLNELTQAEQETYLANAAVTTYGKTSVGGANTNVNVPLSAIKPDVPVTDVTVGGSSVVENSVAIIPTYSVSAPIINNGNTFSLNYNNEQFKLAGPTSDDLTLTNPVPAPGTNLNRGKVLSVNNSDEIIWAAAPAIPALPPDAESENYVLGIKNNALVWVKLETPGQASSGTYSVYYDETSVYPPS